MTSSDFGYKFLDRALSERIPSVRTNPFTTNRVQGPYQRQTYEMPELGQSQPFRLNTDFIRSSMLPQVFEAIGGSLGADQVINELRGNENRERQRERNARNRERTQESIREQRTRPNADVTTPIPFPEYVGMGTREVQPPIPGLDDELVRSNTALLEAKAEQEIVNFEKILDQYPEVRNLLLQDVNKGAASRVRGKDFAPYLRYTDTAQLYSDPEQRAALYDQLRGDEFFGMGVVGDIQEAERLYTSGDSAKQQLGRQMMFDQGMDPQQLAAIEQPAFQQSRPVIGGGGYVGSNDPDFQYVSQRARDFNDVMDNLSSEGLSEIRRRYPALDNDYEGFVPEDASFNMQGELVDYDIDADDTRYSVSVQRGYPSRYLQDPFDSLPGDKVSKNALRFLRDNPVFRGSDISFRVGEYNDQPSYEAVELEPEFQQPVNRFVMDTAMMQRRPGSMLTNSPLGNSDLITRVLNEGKTPETSSYLRSVQPFADAGVEGPSIRGRAYTSAGFSPVDEYNTQYTYIDKNNKAIPIQLMPPENPLTGDVSFRRDYTNVQPAASYKSQPRFYSTLIPGLTPEALGRLAGDIKRTPSSLAPGVADLIPTAEAVRRGYQEGPVQMGQQMATDFVAGLPVAAGLAPVLSNPAVAPLAPGIGAGLLGVAGAEAVNEVVKQQTGKDLLTRVQETAGVVGNDTSLIGTPRQRGDQNVTAQQQLQRDLDRVDNPPQITQGTPAAAKPEENFLERRLRLAREARAEDPGDFGITELLFGR